MTGDLQIRKRNDRYCHYGVPGKPSFKRVRRGLCALCDDGAEYICSWRYRRRGLVHKCERHLCRAHALIFVKNGGLPRLSGKEWEDG